MKIPKKANTIKSRQVPNLETTWRTGLDSYLDTELVEKKTHDASMEEDDVAEVIPSHKEKVA